MIESKQKSAVQALESQFAEKKEQFIAVLPKSCTFERFELLVKTAVLQHRDLLTADRTSLLLACFKCAQDGLLPDGKEAALVMFGAKVQYMPMIGGILKKIRNTGELLHISAHVVYEFDKFRYTLGDSESLDHEPAINERGKEIAAYAIVKLKDGTVYREVMSFSQIEKVRQSSKSAKGGPWANFWGEMARKTVIRRLSKFLPMTAELETVLSRDDEMYEFDNGNNFSRNKNSVIDQINAQLENKSSEEVQIAEPTITETPKFFEVPPLKKENFNSWSEEIIPTEDEITKIEIPIIEEPKNDLPFISQDELNRYIAGAKAGKCTWKELGAKYRMTKEDRVYALAYGGAMLIEPGSM